MPNYSSGQRIMVRGEKFRIEHLPDVGVDHPAWGRIKEQPVSEPIDKLGSMKYEGAKPTYTHTLTSELNAERQVIYEALYTRCDRIADYRRAWQHFSYLLEE